jgi:hypothetical protein
MAQKRTIETVLRELVVTEKDHNGIAFLRDGPLEMA